MYLKHYMPFQSLYITRNHCTQRNEAKALDLPADNSKYVRRGDGIQDVRSHKDLLCNVILFVGRTICVASSISMTI